MGERSQVWYPHRVRWTPEQLAEDAGGVLLRRGRRSIEGAFLDSRMPRNGGLFVPIVAARDGHTFAPSALQGGASALLWQRGRAAPEGDVTIVEVADTLEAFTALARRRRERFAGPVVSVSGSNGKTSTKAMIAAVLATGLAPVLATAGNLNNHLGVPLTLLGEPHEPGAMVLELGMSAPGENRHLASIVRPRVHVVTSVALEHLEFMKTIEAIAAAEAEPLAFLPDDGLAVVPSDEPRLVPHLASAGRAQVWKVGPDADADVRIVDVQQGERTRARIGVRGEAPVTVHLRLFGAHQARNAAAALAVGKFLGLATPAMVDALEQVEPVGDRGRLVPYGRHWIIADCYNANPGSVAAAWASLAQLRLDPPGPRIAVLGDMLELGPDEDLLHAEAGRRAAALGLDALVTLGPRAAAATEAAAAAGLDAVHCDDFAAAVRAIEARLVGPAGGAVLVKGSRGMQLERLIELLLTSQQQLEPS